MSTRVRSLFLIVVLTLALSASQGSAQSTADPLYGRYEPYATFYMNTALPFTQQIILNGNLSTDALLACYYATLASQQFNELWPSGYINYLGGGTTYSQYFAKLMNGATLAYQASQYSYKVYLLHPDANSLNATGWSYYGSLAGFSALSSPAPSQRILTSGTTELFHLYVRAYYGARRGATPTENELTQAAFHHAQYMAQKETTSELEVAGSTTFDTPAIITNFSSFVLKPSTPIGVVVFRSTQAPNIYTDAFLSQFYTPVPGESIGIGQGFKNGFYYYCVYIATKN